MHHAAPEVAANWCFVARASRSCSRTRPWRPALNSRGPGAQQRHSTEDSEFPGSHRCGDVKILLGDIRRYKKIGNPVPDEIIQL